MFHPRDIDHSHLFVDQEVTSEERDRRMCETFHRLAPYYGWPFYSWWRWLRAGLRTGFSHGRIGFLSGKTMSWSCTKEEVCHCFSRAGIVPQLYGITFPRALLVAMFGGFLFLLATGLLGPAAWDWKKITFAAGAGLALFVVLTVPDHFLKEHLWEHVLKKHLLRLAITVRLMSPVPP